MKKKHYLVTLFVTLLVLFAISCGDDNENANDTQPPMIEFLGEELEGLPGETVNIKAKVTDDAVLTIFRLNVQSLNLVKEFLLAIRIILQNMT